MSTRVLPLAETSTLTPVETPAEASGGATLEQVSEALDLLESHLGTPGWCCSIGRGR
jgi:hypothetical protein